MPGRASQVNQSAEEFYGKIFETYVSSVKTQLRERFQEWVGELAHLMEKILPSTISTSTDDELLKENFGINSNFKNNLFLNSLFSKCYVICMSQFLLTSLKNVSPTFMPPSNTSKMNIYLNKQLM